MDNEIIEISTLDGPTGSAESKYGGGIELLMNEKKEEKKGGIDSIQIDDLETLENELNEITSGGDKLSKNDLFSDTIPEIGGSDKIDDLEELPSVSFDENTLGKGTASTSDANDKTSTWDGFNKFNEIPVTPDIERSPKQPQSKEELLREKFQLLRKLESLESKGVQLSKKYTMDSPILEMKGEYETIMDEKAKQNSIKFQGNMLMTFINGLEFLNNRFDPFDVKLEGWSEQVGENIEDYDEVFAELYDKYKSKATMAPELKLLFQLGGSAAMLHMTNTMFKSAMPGMDDILRQNPDLAQQFQKAAVDSMSNSAPGFAGFMNGMRNPDPSPMGGSGPPPPMRTQGPGSVPPPSTRSGNNNSFSSRPDIRGSMGQNDGIDITESFSSSPFEKSSRRPDPPANRAEMKGPSDIDSILSGLKTKRVNMTSKSSTEATEELPPLQTDPNESSTISISDLKEMQSTGGVAPKKSRRRKTSDKNTISLDI
tara:strand:+ start:16450 stop:17901 length:1452 start_codon:yes stop_codon:yes gene_type:complete